jgi:predicted GIY-YIG superfamily endonuclease
VLDDLEMSASFFLSWECKCCAHVIVTVADIKKLDKLFRSFVETHGYYKTVDLCSSREMQPLYGQDGYLYHVTKPSTISKELTVVPRSFLTAPYDGVNFSKTAGRQMSPIRSVFCSLVKFPRNIRVKSTALLPILNSLPPNSATSRKTTIKLSGVPVANDIKDSMCFPSNYHRKLHDQRSKAAAGASNSVAKATMSSQRTGCYTVTGSLIRNVASYAATGAPVVNRIGERINYPVNYQRKVQYQNVLKAARDARRANPDSKAFSYVCLLEGKKVYCGSTCFPVQRMCQHMNRTGAEVTKERPIQAVVIFPHSSIAAAKQAEHKHYVELERVYGSGNVRGAKQNARFSKLDNSIDFPKLLQATSAYELIY